MVRIKNEENFLNVSIESIINFVDEIILINNLSSDKTATIIKKLIKKYPQKIFAYNYPYWVSKIGNQSKNIDNKKKSKKHLATYYNWSMNKCSKSYILKWDGDMVANKGFQREITLFKKTKRIFFIKNFGKNIYPDLRHAIQTIKETESEVFPGCYISYLNKETYKELRLFPKRISYYNAKFPFLENLFSPLMFYPFLILNANKPSFLHLKFLKTDPYSNMPEEMKKFIKFSIRPDEKLTKEELNILSRYKIKNYNKDFIIS
ncbi:MAG: glycosyltransferase [Patescibacteria group bacterium]|jgi:glycosyltransferase involved in cell wall biosynthesis